MINHPVCACQEFECLNVITIKISSFSVFRARREMRLLVLLAAAVLAVMGKDACSSKLCRCSAHLTKAYCVYRNLTYVPKLPKTITNLHFNSNILPNLTAESLFNLSGFHIVNFEFRFDQIHRIDRYAFVGIRKLEMLDVSFNNLSTDSLYNLFTEELHRYLTRMYLKGIGVKAIPLDICRAINSSSVSLVDLSFNELTHFNFTSIQALSKVQQLKLNNNNLFALYPSYLPSLYSLDLFGNQISDLSWFCSSGNFFPKLNSLNLRNNSITTFKPKYLSCLKKLAKLDLSMNYISKLEGNCFRNFPSLNLLSIESQKSQTPLTISAKAFNNKRLRLLFLTNNLLRADRIDTEAFTGCSSVVLLDLAGNTFYTDQEKLNRILAPLEALRQLNMYSSELTRVPRVIGRFTKLKKLVLVANFITDWSANQFSNNTELVELNMASNGIQTIRMEMFPDYLRARLKSIDLRGNAFVCNCDIVWFVKWMRSEQSKFVGYPERYGCLNITERACLKSTAVFISMTTITSVFILVLLAASIVYSHRWNLKYYIYMWRYRPVKVRNITEKRFTYDVFVSYCLKDSDWVLDKLIPTVEEEEQGLKLCVHERDFDGGQLIIDNIIHHMSNSRKVLFVLSNPFAKSEWCRYEVSLAMRLVMDVSIESLVVVILEDIAVENMYRSLNALLNTTTYISWSDEVEESVLWTRLKECLHVRNMENIE